jgi:ribonuclease HIII
MTNTYTCKTDLSREPALKALLEKQGFVFKPADHAFWRAQNKEVTVTFYKSGKLLAQGKDAEAFAVSLLMGTPLRQGFVGLATLPAQVEQGAAAPCRQPVVKAKQGVTTPCSIPAVTDAWESWIGTDESGKGDYFGPLVIASVLADKDNLEKLAKLGVADSKTLNDGFMAKIAPEIKAVSTFAIVTINPAKYNELYKKIANLNNLLAWGHARAIENILEKKPCQNALSDKFGNESLIKNALLKNGRSINLVQRTKAESDIAVAAASILARDEFVRRLRKMSAEYGMDFPKGASGAVIARAKAFVGKYGREKLAEVAKLHFKTTNSLT